MAEINIELVGFGVLFVLIFARMHIGLAMALVGFLRFAFYANFNSALSLLRTVPYASIASYSLSVIPLFVLMGAFCFHAGLSKDLYDSAHKLFGQMSGGLAIATVAACAGFAAISGSSVASAATMATVALPEMRRHKYSDALATGAVAAGGTIGSLIPPSVALIMYGVITEQSIGKLFLAGVFPGLLEAVLYAITIYMMCKVNPLLGPPGPRTSWTEKAQSMKNTWVVMTLFILVLGGIYLGVFSPTEAAGIGAFGAFLFGVIGRRLTRKGLSDSLRDTGKTSGMIFFILVGAMIFNYFIAVSRLPHQVSDFIITISENLIIKGAADDDISMGTIFRGVMPFITADICHVVLLLAVPQISLFLPNLMN